MKLGSDSSSSIIIIMTCCFFLRRRGVSAFVFPAPSATTNVGSRRLGGDLAASRPISYGYSSSSITGCPATPTRGRSSWNTLLLHGSGSVGKHVSSAAASSMRLRSTITETSTEESMPVNKDDNNDNIHESSSSITEMIVELPTNEDNDNELLKLRHSTAHVMANVYIPRHKLPSDHGLRMGSIMISTSLQLLLLMMENHPAVVN
jgi:hypothetical protein